MSDIAITISTDSNYTHYTNRLINSLKLNEPGCDVYCRYIMSTDEVNSDIKHNNINIIEDRVSYCDKKTLIKNTDSSLYYNYGASLYHESGITKFKKMFYSPKIAYACHSRFKSIVDLLDTGYKYVIALDADNIVKKPFVSNLIKNIGPCDIGVVPYVSDQGFSYEFRNEGFLAMKNTNSIRSFMKHVRDYIFYDDNFIKWDIDSHAMESVDHNLNIMHLSQMFKDHSFNSTSYIWCGGNNKQEKKFTE